MELNLDTITTRLSSVGRALDCSCIWKSYLMVAGSIPAVENIFLMLKT